LREPFIVEFTSHGYERVKIFFLIVVLVAVGVVLLTVDAVTVGFYVSLFVAVAKYSFLIIVLESIFEQE